MAKGSDSMDGSLVNSDQEGDGSADNLDNKAAQSGGNRDTGHCTCHDDDVNANIQKVGLCHFCTQNRKEHGTSCVANSTTMK